MKIQHVVRHPVKRPALLCDFRKSDGSSLLTAWVSSVERGRTLFVLSGRRMWSLTLVAHGAHDTRRQW